MLKFLLLLCLLLQFPFVSRLQFFCSACPVPFSCSLNRLSTFFPSHSYSSPTCPVPFSHSPISVFEILPVVIAEVSCFYPLPSCFAFPSVRQSNFEFQPTDFFDTRNNDAYNAIAETLH